MSELITAEPTQPILVDRDLELAVLRDGIKQTLEGRGALVAVAGETGVGKTRLMEELASEARKRRILFLHGAANPSRSDLAYGLFVGVLRDYLQYASSGERQVLQETVAELVPHLGDALFPRTGAASPEPVTGPDPELCQTFFLAALARLLLELSQRRAVVLCLEDLHWADSASLQALSYLATRNEDARLMIVATYSQQGAEEEDSKGTSALLEVLRQMRDSVHFRTLELRNLSTVETRALVSSYFSRSGFGHEFLDALHLKSGGRPLAVRQYVEFLRDVGLIYQYRGLWMDRPLTGRALPETVHATVQKRLDGLRDSEREVVVHAAVQGQTFESEWVAHTLGWPVSRVLHLLESLERMDYVVRLGEGAFRFAHSLLAREFYNCLPESRRLDIHARLAHYLERQRPADAELLAHHFHRAAEMDRALPHLRRAAQRAYQSSAYWEAHSLLNQALEALEEADPSQRRPRRLEVLLALAEADEKLGELDRAEELYREVLRTVDPRQEEIAVGRARLELGWIYYRRGNWQRAAEFYFDALDIFEVLNDARWCATAYLRLGNIDFERSQFDQAAARFNAARDRGLPTGNHILVGGICANLGVVYSVQGRYEEAEVGYMEALQIYQTANYRYGVCQIRHNMGMNYAAQRAWQQALDCYAAAEELARDMGTVDWLANALVSRAATQVNLNALESALAAVQGARIYYVQLKDMLGLAECTKVEGMICREERQHDRAEELLAQARSLFEDQENLLGTAECLVELGRLHRQRGDAEGAHRDLQEASALFAQMGAVEEVQKVETLLAALAN